MVSLVKVRSDVKLAFGNRPGGDDGPPVPVDHGDLAPVRDIQEDPRTQTLHDHVFETAEIGLDIADVLVRVCVYNAQQRVVEISKPAAVRDVKIMGCRIVAHGVGIQQESHRLDQLVGGSVKYSQRALRRTAVGDVNPIHV